MNSYPQTELDKIWGEKASDSSKKSYQSFKDGFFKGLTSKAAEKYWLEKSDPIDVIKYQLSILETLLKNAELDFKENKIDQVVFLSLKESIQSKIHHFTLATKILGL